MNVENELGSWTGEAPPASLPSSPVPRARAESQQGEEQPGLSAQPAPPSSEGQQGKPGGSDQQQHAPLGQQEEGHQGSGHQEGQGQTLAEQQQHDQQQQQQQQHTQDQAPEASASHSQPEPPDKPRSQAGSEAASNAPTDTAAADGAQAAAGSQAAAATQGGVQAGSAVGRQTPSSAGDGGGAETQGPQPGSDQRSLQAESTQDAQPESSQHESDQHEPQPEQADEKHQDQQPQQQKEEQPGGGEQPQQQEQLQQQEQPSGEEQQPQQEQPGAEEQQPQQQEQLDEEQNYQQQEQLGAEEQQPQLQEQLDEEEQNHQQQEQPGAQEPQDKAARQPVMFSEGQHPGEGHTPADGEFTARTKSRISFFGEANEAPVEASPRSKDQGSKQKPASAEQPAQSLPSTSQDRTSPQGELGDDMDKDTKHLVPFHLVDSSQAPADDVPHLRSQISRQLSKQSSSQRLHQPFSQDKQRPSATAEAGRHSPLDHLMLGSGQRGPLRPTSASNVQPFSKQLNPPKLPSRPGSHRPTGPFGIKGFQQQQRQTSSAGSQGYSGSDMSQHTDLNLPLASVMAKGQATKGETPADYMRGHAAGAASRGASKRWKDGVDESRRWSRWGHESNKSRWEEESVAAGLGGSVAQTEDKPKRVFRVAKLGGHTAGVGGHAAKLAELGMMQQQAEQDELFQQPSLQDLVTVKTVNHGDRAVKVDQEKPRRPGHLISNLRGRLPGQTLNKDKDGQTRRLMAAAQNMYGPQPMKRKYVPRPPTPEGITLDGFLMLEAGNDELPEGVVVARLPSRNISNVEVADMAYFTALKLLDLADNRIPDMNMLAPLIGIRALSLAMNKLGPLPMGGMLGEAGASAFQQLSTLDLSYNNLDTHATLGPLSPLARLPSLCELNLSGNKWRKLPDTLGLFTALELLKLAENSLTGSALTPLAALPSLKILGLSRNQIMGLPGLDGTEHNLEEGLMSADLDAHTSFRALHTLDLTSNRVESEDRVKPLQLLPCLKSVLLAGNPLAAKRSQAARRTNQRREYLKARAEKGDVPGPELLEAPQPKEALWVYDPSDHPGPKPSVGRVLTGTGGQFVAIHEPLQRRDAEKAATLAAVTANVPDEALAEAFERADAAMEVWQLNTVPEEEEGEQESGDESDAEPDGTFLTGVGITEKLPKGPREEPEEGPQPPIEQEPSDKSSHGMWEEVSDPTERLALALGLDPSQLAVHTGIPTTDATGSVNALRYALAHPLVELKEGLGPAPKHLETTAAARAKQRPRLQPMAQGPGPSFATAFGRTQAANPQRLRFRTQAAAATTPKVASEASQTFSEVSAGRSNRPFPTDPRTVRVQHVEGMLTGMRSRLDALEGTLKQQLTKLPPEVTSRARRSLSRRMTRSRSPSRPASPSGARSRSPASPGSQAPARPLSPFTADMSVDDEDDDEADADEQLLEPDSPSSPSGRWPQQSGRFDLGRAGSNVSSLPDEVVDAIENSDPSASSGESEDGNDGSGAQKRRSSSPTQHGLRLQLPSPLLRAQKQRQAGNQRYSASHG